MNAYDAIHSIITGRAPSEEPKVEEPVCDACEGGGWEMYGIGHMDPHFRVCEVCFNPDGHPCP